MATAATQGSVQSVVTDALTRFGIEEELIKPEAKLEELDIDSLDVIELGQIVREEFGVELKPEELKDVETVGQVVDLIVARAG